jgi:hypothetical protein
MIYTHIYVCTIMTQTRLTEPTRVDQHQLGPVSRCSGTPPT